MSVRYIRLVGGHVFGHVYNRRHRHHPDRMVNELKTSQDYSGALHPVRQVQGNLPRRHRYSGTDPRNQTQTRFQAGLPFIQKAALKVINNRPVFHTMLRAAYIGQKMFEKEGYIRHLPSSSPRSQSIAACRLLQKNRSARYSRRSSSRRVGKGRILCRLCNRVLSSRKSAKRSSRF